MDTALSSGDFTPGANGRPETVAGAAELFQRAAIRLTVPLGSFSFNPALGSKLYTLPGFAGGQTEMALSFAREALRCMPQLTVQNAVYDANPDRVEITLQYGEETKEIEVNL